MKTIKPQKVGLFHKTFESESESEVFFAVTLFVFFPFEPSHSLLSEVSLWKFAAEELGNDAALDMAMPKPRGEILVSGRAFTPGGVPQTACSVRVKIASVDKTLHVVGDRRWDLGVASEPQPFTELPITYENAFGGPGYAPNPIGKGAAPIRTAMGETHPLPNIEDPGQLLQSPGDRPAPAGLGPYELTWPQRLSKAGTYDAKWLEEGYPGFAKDMDWSVFNEAPADQQIEGYFQGDEAFLLENMHPGRPVIEGVLPGIAARAFINQKTDGGEVFREIETRLETVRLFPHAERGVLVFRGLTKIAEDDAADILHLVAGCEEIRAPKPRAHYEEVLRQRIDKKRGYLFALRDSDLLPAGQAPRSPLEEPSDIDAIAANEGLLAKRKLRKAEIELENARSRVRSLGLNAALYVPEALPPPRQAPAAEDLPEVFDEAMASAEEERAAAEELRGRAEQEARRLCEESGLDFDAIVAESRKKAGGPPAFSARAEIERLRDRAELAANAGVVLHDVSAKLADPSLEERLLRVERELRDTYKKFAHRMQEAAALEGDDAERVREEVVARASAGQRFAEWNLTGASLSGLALKGVDFKDCFLEGADLEGADLRGADLRGAVLVRADLSNANLLGAKLAGANLGFAKLCRADVGGGVDLRGAVLTGADLTGASFVGARMAGVDLSEAIFAETDLSGVTAPGVNFIRTDLVGVRVVGADLSRCNFIDSVVAGVDFSGAKLVSAVFVAVAGDGAVFRGAQLDNLRIVKESSFERADFQGASMNGSNLRGTRLAGSDFTSARLCGADLSECDLRGARLYRAVARDARFMKADLTGAVLVSIDLLQGMLGKAILRGADLRGANLFRADLTKAEVDAGTVIDGALPGQARVLGSRLQNRH